MIRLSFYICILFFLPVYPVEFCIGHHLFSVIDLRLCVCVRMKKWNHQHVRNGIHDFEKIGFLSLFSVHRRICFEPFNG